MTSDRSLPPAKPRTSREDRLKAALKANMARRKAQARARAEDAGDTNRDATQTGGQTPAAKE